MDKQVLIEIIGDQLNLSFKTTDISRLKDELFDDEIVVLSGIRRSGKSTLLQEIRSKHKEHSYYLNFDDDRLLNFGIDDFQKLLEVFIELFGKQNVFYFDEIQNIIGWERFVRRLHDYGNKIFITGSNASMLSKELGTHLTGRYYQTELFPFDFKEFLKLRKIDFNKKAIISTEIKSLLKSQFNDYFKRGGFPAYLKSGNRQYLKSLYESILYRDVMVRNGLTNEKEILELVHYIASNPAKLLTFNSLTKAIGVKNATTVKNYLIHLQDSYLVFLVNKYDTSLKVQLQNPKKAYFIDLGLIKELGFQHSEDNGRLLENLVYIELRRRQKEIYYHNKNKECDFVIKEKTQIVAAIQVCWSVHAADTRKRELEGLLDAMLEYELDKGLILTESEEEEIIIDHMRISIIPVWKWLLWM